jgi:predicted ABC-type ATPase
VELATSRVETRVLEGGHNIPGDVIKRRYFSGIKNLFNLYIPICDYWMIFDNSVSPTELIAEGYPSGEIEISNRRKLEILKSQEHDKKR